MRSRDVLSLWARLRVSIDGPLPPHPKALK